MFSSAKKINFLSLSKSLGGVGHAGEVHIPEDGGHV
jgi:hypothetical protein